MGKHKKTRSKTDAYTTEEGAPRSPWRDDDDVVEAEYYPMGAPIRGIEAPMDMEQNELTEDLVAGEPFHLEGKPSIILKPHIASLLGSGYAVAQLVLARQEKALMDGDEFDASEVAAYSKVIDAVAKLAREERAQEATAEAKDMSEEELDAFLEEAIKKGLLGPGKDE